MHPRRERGKEGRAGENEVRRPVEGICSKDRGIELNIERTIMWIFDSVEVVRRLHHGNESSTIEMVRRTSRDIEKFVTFQNEVNKNYEGERRAERRWKNLNAKQGKKCFCKNGPCMEGMSQWAQMTNKNIGWYTISRRAVFCSVCECTWGATWTLTRLHSTRRGVQMMNSGETSEMTTMRGMVLKWNWIEGDWYCFRFMGDEIEDRKAC
jgi:hypothetical protein